MAGVEQRGGQPQPEQPRQPEQSQKSPEAGAGPLGLPPPTPEQQHLQQEKSVLNRAVERTRAIYERNGWVFLPLDEAGKPSSTLSNPQPEQSQQGEGGSKAKLDHPALGEEMADVKERIEAVRRAARAATFFSGGGLGEVITRKKGKEEQS